MSSNAIPITQFDQIDWPNWTPTETATLMFIVQNDRILLIRKKRGLGAGKINGPGGRVDEGETPAEGAVREAQEELLITPLNPTYCGELLFQFVDGYKLHGYVYKSSEFEGTPTETDEADPIWTALQDIPFNEMWADDCYWFPYMLDNRTFIGRFLFDDDAMLGYELKTT